MYMKFQVFYNTQFCMVQKFSKLTYLILPLIFFKVPVLQFDCRELIFWLGIVTFLCVTLLSIYEILQGGVGKNGSSIAVCTNDN